MSEIEVKRLLGDIHQMASNIATDRLSRTAQVLEAALLAIAALASAVDRAEFNAAAKKAGFDNPASDIYAASMRQKKRQKR
jgi:hypothetical protein